MEVNSSLPSLEDCSESPVANSLATSFIITRCSLQLPVSLLVLYLGHQRWRQQRSFATTSHSDIFTYHLAVVGLVYILGVVFYFFGLLIDVLAVTQFGYYLWCVGLPLEISLHILTCVDRYLAVVHPVIYLGLRGSGWVRIRNFVIGCVWLLSFVWTLMDILSDSTDYSFIPYFFFMILSLVVVSFCSFSVLRVLVRPGPRELGRDNARVDQRKQKAFYTISAILGVLWFCLFVYFITFTLTNSHVLNYTAECLVVMVGSWCSLPSSLVLPLLFLQRSRKMLCCQQ